MNQTTETGAAMATKAAPPIAVAGANLLGVPVPDWIQILTLIYVALMIVHKLWHMGREAYDFWVLKKRELPKE